MAKYFSNFDGTFQYHEGRPLNQTFHIKIQTPKRLVNLRRFLHIKQYDEIELKSNEVTLFIKSNSRKIAKSIISLLG